MRRLQFYWFLLLTSLCRTQTGTASSLIEGSVLETRSSTKNTSGTLSEADAFAVEASRLASANHPHVSNPNFWQKTDSKDIGIQSFNRPCCVSFGPGRIDCFIRGRSSDVFHRTIRRLKEGWPESSFLEDLGGEIIDQIARVSSDVGIIDVLVLGMDNELLVNTHTHQREGLGGVHRMFSDGSAFMFSHDCVCFRLSSDGNQEQYYSYRIRQGQLVWHNGMEVLHGPIGCNSQSPKQLHCFASGVNNLLHHHYRMRYIAWEDWEILFCSSKGIPTVTTWGETRMDVFSLRMDDAVWQNTWNTVWYPCTCLGGQLESPPEYIATGVGRIHCFAIGDESQLFMNRMRGGDWTGWQSLGGHFLDQPSCVITTSTEVACYVRTAEKEIAEIIVDDT